MPRRFPLYCRTVFLRHPSQKLRLLREPDPGLLRLTQACKTVLAVVISIALYWHASLQTRMFAAAGSAYIMQCSSTGPWRRRQLTMLVSGLSIDAAVGIAGMLEGQPWSQDLLLVGVAALAYYFRRFLPDKNQFPIFGFTLCVLAAVLSTGWRQGLHDMLAVATAIPIAFAIYFFLLPPSIVGAARDEIRYFCLHAAELLQGPWDRHRFEFLASRPAFLKGIADSQPDHPAAPRIHQAVNDECALLVIGPSLPDRSGRSGPGPYPARDLRATPTLDALVDLPPRPAAERLAVWSASGRLQSLQARLADAADMLAARPEGRPS
jgi:hypothetical protein